MATKITISGQIIDQSKTPLANLRIEAWDKDLIIDDFVGESISDSKGSFTISFTANRFKELFFDRKPDFYFKIYNNDNLVYSTEKDVIWNFDKQREPIIITIQTKVNNQGGVNDSNSNDPNQINAEKLKNLPSLKNIKWENDRSLAHFLSLSIDQKANLAAQWESEEKLTNTEVKSLLKTVDMLRLTNSNVNMVEALVKEDIKTGRDLVLHNKHSLLQIMKKAKFNLPESKDLDSYAGEIMAMAEAENPSAFFMIRLFDKPELLELDRAHMPSPSNKFKDFYSKNKDFDLKNEPIISLETGKMNEKIKGILKTTSGFIKELTCAQQALQLSSDSTMAALLFKNEVNIRKAVMTTHQSLIRELGIGTASAIEIKQKAQFYHEAAINGYLAYRDIFSNPFLRGTLSNLNPLKIGMLDTIGRHVNWTELKELNGLKNIDSIEDLFGSQNYCECESCNSVLSPAAYFVDLMRFVEKRVLTKESGGIEISLLPENHPIHLKTRRPDLWKLELTCENTNNRIPYVEIVNEVLSAFTEKNLETDKSFAEILNGEQPDLEFLLPYNQYLDEVRVWLSFFKLTRLEVLEYLYPSPDTGEKLILALESLNLSKEQYEIIINQTINATVDTDVLKFRRKSGLSAEETEMLTRLKFWDNKLSIIQKQDTSDIQKYSIEFNSNLSDWKGKLHRLIRLWKSSKWSLTELDLIFQANDILHSGLNNNAILKLATFRRIQNLLALDIKILIGILRGIPERGDENITLSWEKILPQDWKKNDEAFLDDLLTSSTDNAYNLLLKLQGAFGLNSNDLLACVNLLQSKIGKQASITAPVTIVFDINSLNTIYRYIQLYKWTGASSFESFSDILNIWGGGTLKYFDQPVDDIPDFVKLLESFAVDKVSIDDLIYLFGKDMESAEVLQEVKELLTGDEMKALFSNDIFASGDKYKLLFNKCTSIDSDVLSYYRRFLEISDTDMSSLITDLSGTSTSDASYIKFTNIIGRFERLEFLSAKYKIDIETLKIIETESQNCEYPKLGFVNWMDKEWIKELAYLSAWIEETRGLSNFSLWDVLRDIEKQNILPLPTQKAIAKWKKIDLTQVSAIMVCTGSIKRIKKIWDRIDLGKKLNISGELIDRLKTDNSVTNLKGQSQLLQNASRSKFDDTKNWEEQIQDFKNKLSSNTRDALCNFVIFNKKLRNKNFGFENRDDLYSYFLLDVSMGDCFTLPRIVAATNSLQVYIHRCMMGFEQSSDGSLTVLLDLDEQEEWEWRKNYRVWEANRKIFLYPENYIEPEIRDNKSPEFKELEDELLQQKLNSEVVENAYKKYLQQIMTLAELKIAGAYHDKDYSKIYFFGKTNQQPSEYYYRQAEFLENGGILWSNWEKMNVSIPAEDLSAIRYNGKLYVFWTTLQRKDISDVTAGTQKIRQYTYDVYLNYSFLQVSKKWSVAQKFELPYRKNSPFDPFLRLEQFKGMVVGTTSIPVFKDEAVDIRENVLKEFERTVYRKPYPIKTDDRNHLRLDYIWTDKKDGMESIYKYTKATFDGFTKNLIIRMQLPAGGWIESDMEFSFDRFDQIVHWPSSDNQTSVPTTLSITPKTFSILFGEDSLNFTYSFSQNGTKFSLKTGNSSGNKMFFFKDDNKEIKSSDVDIYHQIDYIPVQAIEYQKNLIKLSDQKKLLTSNNGQSSNNSLNREYKTYFDGFTDFYVTDGSDNFADGVNDYKIYQKDMVSILTTPANSYSDRGHNLNPEHIQMLWDKISIGIDNLLDYNTQRHVSPQIDYSKSFGNYFYELFFHIPMRIADHLNAAGKYREANHWYNYIYNPTAIKDQFEQLAFPYDVNWRFPAFRNLTVKKLQEIYSDPNAIEVYQRNPGNPHAIARLRIGAYQKNVVMKYLDNLIDWADYLFEQYTPESTSEARHLYNIIKSILGNKPERTGRCKETRTLTYSDFDIDNNSDFIYNLFTVTAHRGKSSSYYSQVKTHKSNSSIQKMEDNKKSVVSDQKTEGKKILYTEKTKEKKLSMQEITKDIGEAQLMPDKMLGRPQQPVFSFDLSIDLIFCFPHNKDFIQYWNRVDDRIYKLNNCLDINGVKKEMPAYAPEIDPALLARMVAGGMSFDEINSAISAKLPNYRFVYLIEKAKQFCNTVQSFGGALFSAIEKRDGEELTLLRARHEQNILTLTTRNKKKQIEQTSASLAGLQENKTNLEKRKEYYSSLLDKGLIEWETAEQIAKWTSGTIRAGEGVLQLLAGGFSLIPQLGSPFAMKYGGVELSGSANNFAHAMEAIAKIADNVAILAGMEASHQRREQEWKFQMQTADRELNSLNQQIKASEISLTMAEHDLELHQTHMDQYKELYEFYTSKFSNYQHYTFHVQQLQKLYRVAFNLATDLASDAQQAFEFERYGTQFNTGFIKLDNWNNEKVGLLAGERLMLQLIQLEKEFLDTDKRKIEITQHFSLLQIAPDKLYELKSTGECVNFFIPEAAFDLTYPGYFRRIIKSVRLTIPCIAGPYTNIGATLSLGTNKIRKDKTSTLDDFQFKGCIQIATSGAQNDGGQFDLNFRDERYLPFEGAGAISTWTLSLPNARRSFNYNTISDVIFHISYTADFDRGFKTSVEDGMIMELNKIQGNGLIRAFSLRNDFPNEWSVLSSPSNSIDIVLELKAEYFPYFTNIDEIIGIEPKCFIVNSAGKLEMKSDNEGISKENKMKVKIPKEFGGKAYKDLIFLIKYIVK